MSFLLSRMPSLLRKCENDRDEGRRLCQRDDLLFQRPRPGTAFHPLVHFYFHYYIHSSNTFHSLKKMKKYSII